MPTPPFQKSAVTKRGIILLTLTVLSVCAPYYLLIHPRIVQQEMTQAQLFALIKAGRVTSIVDEPNPATGIRLLTGTFKKPISAAPGAPEPGEGAFKVPTDLQLNPYLASEIQQAGYKGTIETQNNTNIFWPLVYNLLPLLLFGALMFLFFLSLALFLCKQCFGPRGT